jgi:prepilin-type N-terminal cleavage/methylation domain-containing protein
MILRRLRSPHGFTIVETLVTMAILGIVMGAFGQTLLTSSKTSSRVEEQATLQNEVRVAVDDLTMDFRQATNTNATSPVESISSSSLTFLSPDRLTPFHMRRISYRLLNGELQRSIATSTDTDGWPWVFPVAPATFYPQVGSVTGTSIFTFYDASGVVTTNPATVRSARVSVTVAPNQSQGGMVSFSALVSIRTLQ